MAAKKTASPRVRLARPKPMPKPLALHTTRMKGIADGATSPWQVEKALMRVLAGWKTLREEGAKLVASADDYLLYTLPGHFSDEPGGPCLICDSDD